MPSHKFRRNTLVCRSLRKVCSIVVSHCLLREYVALRAEDGRTTMEPISLDKIPPYKLDGNEQDISACVVLAGLNYGGAVFSELHSTWGCSSGLASMYWIWDTALVSDLERSLFGAAKGFDRIYDTGYCEEDDTTFDGLRQTTENLLLLQTLAKCSQTMASSPFMFPHSYIIAGLTCFVSYLRIRVQADYDPSEENQSTAHSFTQESAAFWKRIYCTNIFPYFD